ncbi:MAG: von Willebrand factor type A domain-containing protein [Verrucomicrobiota bacterium]
MKNLRPDDPNLTARALGEATPQQAEVIDEEAEKDATMTQELQKTQALGKLLSNSFEQQRGTGLSSEQEVMPRQLGRNKKLLAMREARRRSDWGRGLGVAVTALAIVAAALLAMQRVPVSDDLVAPDDPEELSLEVVLSPSAVANWKDAVERAESRGEATAARGESEKALMEASRESVQRILRDPQRFFASAEWTARQNRLPEEASFVPLLDNDYIRSRDVPETRVPVMAGRTSFAWVERFLREKGELPPRDAVRLEELVNYPDYLEEAQATAGGVSLASELVRCPWNEEGLLLGILVQRKPGSELEEKVSVKLEVEEQRVEAYRLLGFARPDGEMVSAADAAHPLAAGRSTYVFYELKLSDGDFDSASLGKLGLRVTSQGTTTYLNVSLPSLAGRWVDSSNSFRTAATVAAYALVLRDSPFKGNLSLPRVESLARQTLVEHPRPSLEMREVLNLIIETRDLAGLAPQLSVVYP